MKSKKQHRLLVILMCFTAMVSCKQKDASAANNESKISVYDYDNAEALNTYNSLNLDASYPNLLNPKTSKNDYNAVVKSWTDLHRRIGKFLSENNFNWQTKDSTITIVQKIYFKPNGNINHYFFKVLNDDISEETRVRFSNLITDFAKNNTLTFQQNTPFAQCGKTKYIND